MLKKNNILRIVMVVMLLNIAALNAMLSSITSHFPMINSQLSILNSHFSIFNSQCAYGQISIGGNVYGGGNKAEVKGNTRVRVRAGNLGARPMDQLDERATNPTGRVFGGARMANVGGNAYVNIDAAHASEFMVINKVFGGNDISGVVGSNPDAVRTLPEELAGNSDGVDASWDAYVHLSTKMKEEGGKEVVDESQKTFIGQVFAGGNGDFTYTDEEGNPLRDAEGNYVVQENGTVIAISPTPFSTPVLKKSYLDMQGGTIVYAYGGGNNATVTEKAVVHVDNPSAVVTEVKLDADGRETADGTNIITKARQQDMGVNSVFSQVSSDEFQVNCLFGGNNKADMAIHPTWNLQDGKVRSLYSGGNRGRMIHEDGLFLEIPATSTIKVNNVFGGCRMADVRPMKWNETLEKYEDVDWVSGSKFAPYQFPSNLAARVIVAGGDVNNVFGGNDVRGRVWFGNAVGIQTSIRGDVYGGGNGAYPYTDNEEYRDSEEYGDYFFSQESYATPEDALNALRPDAEQVSIQLRGTEGKPTIIGGSVYVGGNCATLRTDGVRPDPLVELKIGSHVIANNVFLGNNGASMVDNTILELYDNSLNNYNSLNLKDSKVFARYMKGVSLNMLPKLVVEQMPQDRVNYKPYSSYIGSLYYGGNRGSMTYSDSLEINLNLPIIIYDKLVGGCNDANITATEHNARYEGGIMGTEDEQTNGYLDSEGNIQNRIIMSLSDVRFKPMRLNSTGDGLEWNTWLDGSESGSGSGTGTARDDDKNRRLKGGNVFGGCYTSGHVHGNVVVNLNDSLVNRHEVFDAFEGEEVGDNILYDYDDYTITKRNSGVILNEQGMDVLGEALSVYAGGKGKGTQIWGSTTVNINKGYTFQVFGGSDEGTIGKGTWNESTDSYDYPEEEDERYSTYVNLNSKSPGVSRPDNTSEDIADVEFIYGGGFSGPILGSTHVRLDNGRLFNLFAGSCNADINGHTETYVGLKGFPYLRDHIYGGNDLGGTIWGEKDFTDRLSDKTTLLPMIHTSKTGEKDVL